MTKITIIEQTQIDGTIVEFVEIEHLDGTFTSMPKAVYEAQQVEHLTEIPTPDEA